MMDIALIIDGMVDTIYRNADLADFADIDGEYYEAPAGEVFAGFTYDGSTFSPPDPVAPSTDPNDYPLLPWQFKALVVYLGKDVAIRTEINKITDDLQRAKAMSRYENATNYVYNDPLMQSMREAVGLSEQELTTAWMQAKDLAST
jgi:hypothetical protein